jgi:hypothetical protein
MTGQQLEVLCRKYAVVQRHAGANRPDDERRERYVQRRDLASGMIRIEVVLHPEEAARADGLMALARSFAARPVLEGLSTPPVEITLTVPAAGLAEDAPVTVEHVGVLGDGDAVSPEAARRVACDAAIVTVIEGADGAPLAVGRRSRVMSTAMRRAMLKRDRTCRFPGCTNHLYVEGHHIQHWANGGETALGNLVTLCSHHHRFVHEYRYRIELAGDGEPRFFDPHGRVVEAAPLARPAGEVGWLPMVGALHAAGVRPTAPACWDESDVDDDLLISALCRVDDGEDEDRHAA